MVNWPHPAPAVVTLLMVRVPAFVPFVSVTVCDGAGTPTTAGGPTCGRVVENFAKPVGGSNNRNGGGGLMTAPLANLSVHCVVRAVTMTSNPVCTIAGAPGTIGHVCVIASRR